MHVSSHISPLNCESRRQRTQEQFWLMGTPIHFHVWHMQELYIKLICHLPFQRHQFCKRMPYAHVDAPSTVHLLAAHMSDPLPRLLRQSRRAPGPAEPGPENKSQRCSRRGTRRSRRGHMRDATPHRPPRGGHGMVTLLCRHRRYPERGAGRPLA